MILMVSASHKNSLTQPSSHYKIVYNLGNPKGEIIDGSSVC